MDFLIITGRYIFFLKQVFTRLEKRRVYWPKVIHEINELGMSSIGFVAFISVFVGAVVTIQVAYNLENPLLPKYLIGLASRDTLILEFCPTISCFPYQSLHYLNFYNDIFLPVYSLGLYNLLQF